MGSLGDRPAIGPWIQLGPQGRQPRPGYLAPHGVLRGDAIPLRGFKLVRVWFDFPDRRIEVPQTPELGPFAGDVHDNGNVVYMVQFGACCSNSIIYVS